MPTPRLTKIGGVLARGPAPAMTGKWRAADGPQPRQDDLSAVGVPAEHQRHRERGGFEQARRGVRQQDQHSARPRASAGRCPRRAGSSSGCRQVERLAADTNLGAGVPQHGEPRAAECRRHVVIVVVVAEHREDAVTSACRPASASAAAWTKSAIAPGDVVAAQHDQVGALRR